MKMSEVRKGLRVRLAPAARARHTLPTDVAIDLGRSMLIVREIGTVLSPKPVAVGPPYQEGLVVYVRWDGLLSREAWDLPDLEVVP